MTSYVAFLRGINVGGKSMLPMPELKLLCEKIGFLNVRTYINSGNVLFESELEEEVLIRKLEEALLRFMKNPIPVMVRSLEELESVLEVNPFPKEDPAKVGVMFFGNLVPSDLLKEIIVGTEKVEISGREIYIYFPEGMGRAKLKFPKKMEMGTVRNINTIGKLVGIDRE